MKFLSLPVLPFKRCAAAHRSKQCRKEYTRKGSEKSLSYRETDPVRFVFPSTSACTAAATVVFHERFPPFLHIMTHILYSQQGLMANSFLPNNIPGNALSVRLRCAVSIKKCSGRAFPEALFCECVRDYLLENWGARRAACRAYFLRSFILGSRVMKPAFLSTARKLGSATQRAREMP